MTVRSFFVLFLFFQATCPTDMGGIVCRMPRNDGFSCGERPYAAFFFDSNTGECLEFLFKGCGGNQNRFLSRRECEDGCNSMILCAKGLPLMDIFGNIKRCEGDRLPCPATHFCVGQAMKSVCCHKADRLCSLSVHTGTPCGVSPQTRFYFDTSASLCRPFSFSGCGGNENNFRSKGECTKFCSSRVICPKGDPYPDNFSANRIATCHSDSECPKDYSCLFIQDRKGACCPSKVWICGKELQRSRRCPQRLNQTWTFNHKRGECSREKEPLCSDELNTFVNAEQCIDFCIGSCPDSQPLFINPYTNMPQLCNKEDRKGCPIGYDCHKSSPFSSICCRSVPVCPAGESIAAPSGDGPQRCEPESADCPAGYSCQQASNLENICCSQPLTCPEGMAALRDSSSRPRICSRGVEGSCPPEYFCILGQGSHVQSGTSSLCCRPDERCLVPFVHHLTHQPQKCFPGDGRCPLGSRCLAALDEHRLRTTPAVDVSFYCCLSVQVMTCKDGSSPLIHRQSRSLFRCTMGGRPACPAKHNCELLADGTTACCERKDEECIEALLENGEPVVCSSDSDCLSGMCRRAVDGRLYCCVEIVK